MVKGSKKDVVRRRKVLLVLFIVFLALILFSLGGSLFSVGGGDSSSLTNYYSGSSSVGLFSVGGDFAGGGDVYYEERCVDVVPYIADGYYSSGSDENGCPLVTKRLWVDGSDVRINTRCNNRLKTMHCHERVSPSHSFKECDGSRYIYCAVPYSDVKGGLERVANSCSYDVGDMLVAETFNAGQVIDKFDLRYPLKGFCRGHPVVITDGDTLTSYTSTDVQQSLINGDSVTVGSSETMTVLYIIQNNFDLPISCGSGDNLALDVDSNFTVDNGICKSTLGFSYVCSEGVFDASSGVCVVQPSSATVCDQGRYDVGLDRCVYNPPLQVDCGSNNCYYDLDRDVCSCFSPSEFNCPEGFTFKQPVSELECSAISGVWSLCPACPSDQICPESMCVPSCDRGQVCEFVSGLVAECMANDYYDLSFRGICKVYSDSDMTDEISEYAVCGEGMSYNADGEVCELNPTVTNVCADGSTPQEDNFGGLECIVIPETFYDCGEDLFYDMGLDRCVPSSSLFVDGVFVPYDEVRSYCADDSVCQAISSELICDVSSGVCHTDLSGFDATSFSTSSTSNNSNEDSPSKIIFFVIAGIIIIGVVGLFFKGFKSKKGKRK